MFVVAVDFHNFSVLKARNGRVNGMRGAWGESE